MFSDSVQAKNEKLSNVSFIQTLNKFVFEKIIDVVKKLKKELKSEYKKK